MKLVLMHDGNVINADAITHIIREENYSYIYFAGGTKLSYVETPAELAKKLQDAAEQQESGRRSSKRKTANGSMKALPGASPDEADRKALPLPDASEKL